MKKALTLHHVQEAIIRAQDTLDTIQVKDCVYSMQYLLDILRETGKFQLDTSDIEYNGWQNDFFIYSLPNEKDMCILVSGSLFYNDLSFKVVKK